MKFYHLLVTSTVTNLTGIVFVCFANFLILNLNLSYALPLNSLPLSLYHFNNVEDNTEE